PLVSDSFRFPAGAGVHRPERRGRSGGARVRSLVADSDGRPSTRFTQGVADGAFHDSPTRKWMTASRAFTPVRIGVVGLGRFGQLHAQTLAGLAEAELTGVVARRRPSLDQMRTKLPGVPGWLD